jgi:hypothetical protein
MKYQDNYASPYEKYFLDEVKFNSKNPYDLIKALVRIFGFGDVKKKLKIFYMILDPILFM